MAKKISVQLVQLNNRYGNQVYLPYSVGVLKAFVDQNAKIKENYHFKEFIFLREDVSNMIKKVGQVDILGISCYIWNWRISLKLAEEVRNLNPNCMIILGGPHVPNKVDEEFFNSYPYVDMTMHGEGELTWEEVLTKYPDKESLKNITGTSFHDRKGSKKIYYNKKRERNLY